MENYADSQDVQSRLSRCGFAFNPFERLEASNDPYIAEYLIGHEMFSVAWENSPAALFAPPGGGKTAMRIYTLRACWLGESQRRKFPISYDLPLFASLSELNTLNAHQMALASAASADIFLTCAYRPELYTNLSPERRLFLLSLVQQAMPVDLTYAVNILQETAVPKELAFHLDRTYLLPMPPSEEKIRIFCDIVQKDLSLLSKQGEQVQPDRLLENLLDFIVTDLSFGSIFVLLDGVDGTGGQVDNPDAQFAILAPLLEHFLVLAKRGVYLKLFLPSGLESIVAERAKKFYQKALHAAMLWDIPKLAEILRRRVYVASQGRFGSLDALSSPALRDVETLIASRCRPLPREAIMLAGLVLENYLERRGDYLEPEDIAKAEEQYLRRSIFPE